MSRSWTSALARSLPHAVADTAAAAKRTLARFATIGTDHGSVVGVAIGRRGIACARATSEGEARRVQWAKHRDFVIPFFKGVPTQEHIAVLAGAVAELCTPVARSFIPIYIVLPDPAAHFNVFELEQLPASARAQSELVRWRYGKEVFNNGREFDCTSQYLGESHGKFLLLGLAIDREWLDCVRRSLQQAGVIAWGVSTTACYQFNRFHPILTKAKRGAALISLDGDAWTLSIWDAAGRLRYVHSRWRGQSTDASFYADIAAESERIILAYVRGDAQRAVACLYVHADAHDREALMGTLNQRVKDGAISLPVDFNLRGGATAEATLGIPLTAAIAQ